MIDFLAGNKKKAISFLQSEDAEVKLQYQNKDLPKVWRNGQFHDWRHHYRVYQNATATKTPIYQGWKEGKLIVEAGGYKFQTQP